MYTYTKKNMIEEIYKDPESNSPPPYYNNELLNVNIPNDNLRSQLLSQNRNQTICCSLTELKLLLYFMLLIGFLLISFTFIIFVLLR